MQYTSVSDLGNKCSHGIHSTILGKLTVNTESTACALVRRDTCEPEHAVE